MKNATYLLIIIILSLGLPFFFSFKSTNTNTNINEGFSNYTLEGASGSFPSATTNVLVQDTFDITGINGVSDRQASNMWKQYPIFEVGSYDQITNNIRYSRNPDTGRCMAADFCDALYKNRKNKSNYVKPLPPVNQACGTRVGYFTTDENLLPFRTETANILY